ncbi:MAG: hypothetical protein HEQ10_00870 [Dolichospermum sp. DEX182a]|nr:hypothetical protein [Dolichospermum sp. DEX182a]QSV61355.1 MAG: hypothetical protein HEQ26_05690 [Dolichospermum sp. DL01]
MLIKQESARISHKQCDSYGALRYRNLYNPYRETGIPGMPGMFGGGNPLAAGGNRPAAGWRGYPGGAPPAKKKKEKKKKGFGTL